MGDLDQEIIVFPCVVNEPVGVFEIVPPIFLCIKAFIFSFPSASSSLVGDFRDISVIGSEVCNPCELGGFVLLVLRFGFLAEYGMETVSFMIEILCPGEILCGLLGL